MSLDRRQKVDGQRTDDSREFLLQFDSSKVCFFQNNTDETKVIKLSIISKLNIEVGKLGLLYSNYSIHKGSD